MEEPLPRVWKILDSSLPSLAAFGRALEGPLPIAWKILDLCRGRRVLRIRA